jgi:hypothetical protein
MSCKVGLVPGLRVLLRFAPFVVGAFAVAVWLERRRRARIELPAPPPQPELEPATAPVERLVSEPAPEPIDIVTVVDDLLMAGR